MFPRRATDGRKKAIRDKNAPQRAHEETQHFAPRDHKLLIAELKHAQEEHKKMICNLARDRCPQCGERLHPYFIYGEMIDECAACQGMWLTKAKMEAVSHRGGEEWEGSFLEGLGRLSVFSLCTTKKKRRFSTL
jgi:hypothetical protein